MIRKTEEPSYIGQKRLVTQFSFFTLVGILGTLVHFVVLTVLVELVFVNPVGASAVGAVCGAIVNYILNYRLTFKSDKPHIEAFPRFISVASVGFVLNALLMYFFVEAVEMFYILAQVITMGVVLIWNFNANRVWTFSGKESRV